MSDTNQPIADREAEIRTRVAEATPGPWGTRRYLNGAYTINVRMELSDDIHGDDVVTSVPLAQILGVDDAIAYRNSRFIAHARKDVPFLLDEIDRLRGELEPYEVMNPQQCPKGIHADWLVDSENTHACPWCQIDELKNRTA